MQSHASQKRSQMGGIQYVEAQIIEAICYSLLSSWMAFSSVKPVSPRIHKMDVFSDPAATAAELFVHVHVMIGINTRLGQISQRLIVYKSHKHT